LAKASSVETKTTGCSVLQRHIEKPDEIMDNDALNLAIEHLLDLAESTWRQLAVQAAAPQEDAA
jgi:hypothetical protein